MEHPEAGLVRPLPWDSDLWGCRVGTMDPARIDDVGDAHADVHTALTDFDLVYLLVPASRLDVVQRAEATGFRTMDLRCQVTLDLDSGWTADRWGGRIERLETAVGTRLDEAAALAGTSHMNTRFGNDPALDRAAVEELYRRWLRRDAARPSWTVDVAIDDADGTLAGYVSHGRERDGVGTVGLIGVASGARGRGLGRRLLEHAVHAQRVAGCRSMEVITQGGSAAAMAMYRSAGFRVDHLAIWMHWHRTPSEHR